MGVSNDSHVVLYDNNPNFGFYSVGRVWWMFKVSPLFRGVASLIVASLTLDTVRRGVASLTLDTVRTYIEQRDF